MEREGEGREKETGKERERERGKESSTTHVSFAIERVGHYICTNSNLVWTFILEHILVLQKCLCSHLHKSRDNHLGAYLHVCTNEPSGPRCVLSVHCNVHWYHTFMYMCSCCAHTNSSVQSECVEDDSVGGLQERGAVRSQSSAQATRSPNNTQEMSGTVPFTHF